LKRLITLLLVLMQLPLFARAESTEYVSSTPAHAQALTALGIIDELDEKAFSVDEPITRADFVKIIAGLVNYTEGDSAHDSVYYRDVSAENEIAGRVDYLTDLGFVLGVGDGLFHPEESVETVQVITVLAKILGYDEISKYYGGYPSGYMKSLREAGVKFSLESNDQLATGSLVTELVYQSLDATMRLTRLNGEVYRDDSVTILSKYHEIEIGEGIVTKTSYSDARREGLLTIDEHNYSYFSRDVGDWLGSQVKYFYDEDSTVLYLEQHKKNRIIDLSANLIEEIADDRFYYYTDGSYYKSLSKRIGAAVDYIYNGVRVIPQPGEDMNKYLPQYEGSVRLVDNNNDGILDYIIILDYDTFVVSDLITEECIYYDKYTQRLDDSGQVVAQEALDLSDEIVEFAHITDAKTGVFLERSDITKGVVLSVAKSLDGKVVHIIVSDKTVTGTATSSGTDEKGRIYVTIGDQRYLVAPAYTDFKGKIPNGTKATFKLTGGNVVVDFEVSSNYAYLIDVKEYDENGEEKIVFQVYTVAGTFEKYLSAEKVTVNQNKNVLPGRALELLRNGGTSVEPGVVILEQNAAGEVRKIYTKDAEEASEKKIYKSSCFSNSPDYDSNLTVFSTSDVGEIVNQNTKNIGGKIAFRSDTILFDIPESPKTAAKSDFGVSMMSSYAHYTYMRDIELYRSDKDSLESDVIVRQATGQVNIPQNQEAVVISSIYEMIDELGDTAICVEGYRVGVPVTYIANDREKLVAQRVRGAGTKVELGVGDIARFTFATNGRIAASEIMFDASKADGSKIMQTSGDAPDTGNRFNHGFRLQKAKIYRIERGHLVITREALTDMRDKPALPATYELMPTNSKTHCWVVDFSKKKVLEEINLRELKDYMSYGTDCDEVHIYQRESAYDIMLYR